MQKKGAFSYDNKSKSGKSSKKGLQIYFLLISDNKFGVSIPYNALNQNIKIILRRSMAQWNKDMKLWISSLDNYKHCISQIREYFNKQDESKQSSMTIIKIPDFVFKASEQMKIQLQVKNQKYSIIKTINYNSIQTEIDPKVLSIYPKLYDFQKESLQFGIKKHGRLLLADEMGVGKTIQSLAIISIYRHQWPFLVICPSSLRLNWQQEILNWLGQYIKKSQIQVYSKGGTSIKDNIKAIIISYDLAWKCRDMLQKIKAVISDEAHYLKNVGNKRSDILTPFLSTRKRVVLLTGTPALAKPRQIFNLISIIRPDVFVDFKEFGYRYCEPTRNHWSHKIQYNGCQNSKQLHFLLKDRVMIRRLKREVLTQLPDKQRQKINIQTDKNVIKQIKQLLNKQGGLQGNNLENMVIDILCNFNSEQNNLFQDTRVAITKAYSLTGLAKLQASKQYVLQLLENNIKLIIFAHHKNVLDGLEEGLKQKNYKYIRIDGTISNQRRHECVNLFQQKEQIMVALLSITAAGVGLTLTAASTVVFAQLHWTPGMMVQAEDRAHRIGQKSSVNCHYLIGENTLDDVLYRFLERKINNVSSFVDGKAEKLEMQSLSKGQKGKVSLNQNSNTISIDKQRGILFKFESIRPVIDKYFIQQSQDTEISDTNLESKSLDNNLQNKNSKIKNIKQPYQIQETSGRKQMEIQKLEAPQKIEENFQQSNAFERSSQMCNFILQNAQSILQYSQKLQSDSESEQTLSNY